MKREEHVIRTVLDIEERLKGRKLYHDLAEKAQEETVTPGPRAAFIAAYGASSKNRQERILKTDKAQIAPGRAQVHYEHGCDTLNDFNVLVSFGPDAYKHHVSPVVDFWSHKDTEGRVWNITAEKYFAGYRSVASLMHELREQPLTKQEFKTISSHVLDALRYTDEEQQVYHRDFSLRNIITNIRTPQTKKAELEAIVTDYANACKKDHPTAKPQVTAGARQVTDPLLLPSVAGRQRAYDDQAETYAVAKDFLEMLLGEQVMDIDQLGGTAQVRETSFTNSFSLVDARGVFQKDSYRQVMQAALARVPAYAKRFVPVLRKALSIDASQRFSSTQEFINAWQKHEKRRVLRGISVAAGTIGMGALLLGAGYSTHSFLQETPKESFRVHTEWNKETNDIENNYLRLRVNVNSTRNMVLDADKMFVKRGDDISTTLTATYQALDRKFRSLDAVRGIAYIEGPGMDTMQTQTFSIVPKEAGLILGEQGGYNSYAYLSHMLKVPADAADGTVYNAVFELYPYHDTIFCKTWNNEIQGYNNDNPIIFESKDKAFLRKKIPLIIESERQGKDPVGAMVFSRFTMEPYVVSQMSFRSTRDDEQFPRSDSKLGVSISIPELGYVKQVPPATRNWSNTMDIHLDFPEGPTREDLTLQVITSKDGKVMSQFYAPLKRVSTNTGSAAEPRFVSSYTIMAPESSFERKIKQYAKGADRLRE